MPESKRLFVGIDWASESHQVCALDPEGRQQQRSFEHSGDGLGQLVDWLVHLSNNQPDLVAVAIEITRGAVIETLLERGFSVFAINPKQLDRFRDRHTVAGAKDDRRDAFVLADSLRTDEPLFRRLQIEDPTTIQLREMSRLDEDLRDEQGRLSNRLWALLHRFYPQLLRLVPAADEPWLWELLELAPDPALASKTKPKAIAKLLRENRVRRLTPEEILAALRATPLRVAPGTVEACSTHVAFLIPQLRLLREQRLDCGRRLERLLELLSLPSDSEADRREHRDVQILRSLPGVGRTVAATMLAEASRPLARRDYAALRTQSGVAPVTHATGKSSGKRATVLMRRACHPRLREALYHWARTSMQRDELSRAYYRRVRSRGHSHGRALRSLADRLLRILVAMLRAGTLYQSDRPLRVTPGATVPALP